MNWKRGSIASVLSLLVPGLGQLYNRQLAKSIGFLLCSPILLLLGRGLIITLQGLIAFFSLSLAVTIWAVIDACRVGLSQEKVAILPRFNRPVLLVAIAIIAANIAGSASHFYEYRLLGIRASVQSSSVAMSPIIKPGDRVITNMRAFADSAPQRGEVVMLVMPGTNSLVFKRVVAVGGDTVEGAPGGVILNGQSVGNPYNWPEATSQALYPDGVFGPVKVPPGSFFVMGDNVPVSYDSRYFGNVTRASILGKPKFIYWSPDHSRIGKTIK